jgi:hypothetical protein
MEIIATLLLHIAAIVIYNIIKWLFKL